MSSPVYWHPILYKIVMRLLYGGEGYEDRYRQLSAWIPAGSNVFEACAGDCRLYLKYLRPLGVNYQAGDFNPTFVAHGRKQGVFIRKFDLRKDAVPSADIVLLQASLYQFLPDAADVLLRLAKSAKQRLIVVEPIRNLASSDNLLIAWLGKLGASTDDGHHPGRFDEASISKLMSETFGSLVTDTLLIGGGREKLFCVSTDGVKFANQKQ